MKNIRNSAGDIIKTPLHLIREFNVSIFGVIGYKKGKNEADLVNFLNYYREFENDIVDKK